MALFNDPFSLEFSIPIGYLDISFFINENLYVTSAECFSVPHNHHDFELRYIESGECNQIIEDTSIVATAGDMIVVPPMKFHCQLHRDEDSISSQYNFRFLITPPNEKKQSSTRAYAKITNMLQKTQITHDDCGTILILLKLLSKEMYNKKPGYISAVQSLSSMILIEVFRAIDEDTTWLFPKTELKFRGYERTQIDEFFRRKYFLPDVKIEDFAKDMRLSTRQVNRIMYKMFGISFSQRLKEMRLHRAAFLLKYTDKMVTDISLECGFKSYSNFYTCFQKEYGITPTEYRTNQTEKTDI